MNCDHVDSVPAYAVAHNPKTDRPTQRSIGRWCPTCHRLLQKRNGT